MVSLVPSILAGFAYYIGIDTLASKRDQAKGIKVSAGDGARPPMLFTTRIKFAAAAVLVSAIGGAWVLYKAQLAAARRKINRARRSSHRQKRSLGELSEFDAGKQSTAKVIIAPKDFPAVSTSLLHLVLPPRTRTRPEICFASRGGCVSTFFVISGSGVALVDGTETAIGPGDSLVFRPGTAFYVANTGWRGVSMALLWLSEPAAPPELLASDALVDSYDDGSGMAVRAARAMASGLYQGAGYLASNGVNAASTFAASRQGAGPTDAGNLSPGAAAAATGAAAAAANGSGAGTRWENVNGTGSSLVDV